MKTPLLPNEHLIEEGAANLQRGLETVGGRLFLTDHRLVFEPHAVNLQRGVTVVDLAQVQSTRACWTKFLGLIPLFPNSLAVYTKEGTEFRFVLFGRHAWNAAIQARLQAR
jgi:hypothetical protein